MNSLLRPMRVEVPAASTIPATDPERSGMDRLPFLAQVARLLARDHGEQLAHDADGDLLGTVGAEAETDRREHARIAGRIEAAEHLVRARTRAEQPDVLRAAREKALQPVAV